MAQEDSSPPDENMPPPAQRNNEEKASLDNHDGTDGQPNDNGLFPPVVKKGGDVEGTDTTMSSSSNTPTSQPMTLSSDPAAAAEETYEDGPPALPFSIYEHKRAVFLFWFAIAAESCFIPLSFFYGFWFGTNLNHGARTLPPLHHVEPSLQLAS